MEQRHCCEESPGPRPVQVSASNHPAPSPRTETQGTALGRGQEGSATVYTSALAFLSQPASQSLLWPH